MIDPPWQPTVNYPARGIAGLVATSRNGRHLLHQQTPLGIALGASQRSLLP